MISSLPDAPLDLIGDVHGEHDALARLLHHLGYDERDRHPDGRHLVFVGDLCDRGPDSPGVIERVRRLVEDGRASAILGNHELNLLRLERREGNDWFWSEGAERDRKFQPCASVSPRQGRALLDFLGRLPLALEREDLRVVHAAWHAPAIRQLREAGADAAVAGQFDRWEAAAGVAANAAPLRRRVEAEEAQWAGSLADPACAMPMLEATALRDQVLQMGNPLRVLSSGIERAAARPFFSSGKWRFVERVRWWDEYADATPVVVGHYWRRLVPMDRSRVGKGGPDLFEGIDPLAWHGACGNVFCVDYSAGGRFHERGPGGVPGQTTKLAALRWPERTLVFDTGERLQTRGTSAPGRVFAVSAPRAMQADSPG